LTDRELIKKIDTIEPCEYMNMPLKNLNSYPNISLIVIDALRAGNVGTYGADNGATHNMDAVAKEGLVFEDVYSTWNTTDQSLTSILTGKYPLSHGITNHGDTVTPENLMIYKKTGTRPMGEILRDYGYETIAIDWMGRWFKKGFDQYGIKTTKNLFTRGALYAKYILNHMDIFHQYADKRGFKIPSLKDMQKVFHTFLFSKELAQIQDAAMITDLAIESVKNKNQDNFFLFLHYWDTHTPYHCPREYQAYRGSDKRKKLISKYEGAIHYVDQQLGRLFQVLKANHSWDNTLIIITSDHGESLTEHDIFFDHHGLYDVTIHVPLIVCYPGYFHESKRISGFVQHTDLLPTVLDILNIRHEKYHFDGCSLIPLINNNASNIHPFIYTEESYVQKKRALRTGQYKYICATDGKGYCSYCHKIHSAREELYDLGADPFEEKNIIKEKPQVHKELEAKLKDLVQHLIRKRQEEIKNNNLRQPEKSDSSDNNQEEEMVRRRLRALGYMD
jgi:arylsulfatase